jgi:hypothetical protein
VRCVPWCGADQVWRWDPPCCLTCSLFMTVVAAPVVFYLEWCHNRAFQAWVARTNVKYFEPRGMYMSYQYYYSTYPVDICWLVVATTRDEALMLRQV